MSRKKIVELESIIRKSCEETSLSFDNMLEKDFDYIIKRGKIYGKILEVYNNKEKIINIEDLAEIKNKELGKAVKKVLENYGFSIFDINEIEEDMTDIFDTNENINFQTSVDMYLNEIKNYPLLTPEEEVKLFTQYNENRSLEVRNKILNANLRLSCNIAKRYLYIGEEMEDLIQYGNEGLIKAIDRFDVTKGFKFSTYATWWVKQAITRGIADHSRTVRVPVYLNHEYARLKNAEKKLQIDLARKPTDKELAEELNIKTQDILELKRIFDNIVSLDSKIVGVDGDQDATIGDFVASNTDTETEALKGFITKDIYNAFDKCNLTRREIMVLEKRFGLMNNQEKTLEELGKEFNLTRERVRQIESKALRKLRCYKARNLLEDHLS